MDGGKWSKHAAGPFWNAHTFSGVSGSACFQRHISNFRPLHLGTVDAAGDKQFPRYKNSKSSGRRFAFGLELGSQCLWFRFR